MASFTVYGWGNTTAEAYTDALERQAKVTEGDKRDWVVSDQSYRVTTDRPPVECELTLELIETL